MVRALAGALAVNRVLFGIGYIAAHAIADGTDLAATIAARDKLPASGYRFAMAMAGASTAIAAAAALLLPSGSGESP